MKKILFISLVFSIVSCFVSCGSDSDDENITIPKYGGTCYIDGIYYKLNNGDKTAAVTKSPKDKYNGGDMVITSPIYYNGIEYDVKSIEREAFMNCIYLTSIVIPNSVTRIERYAFTNCERLTSITIPESVVKIDRDVFSDYLKKIIINSNTLVSKDYKKTSLVDCFTNQSIEEVVLGDKVTRIGDGAFALFHNLTTIYIPNSVTSIGKEAFSFCWYMKSVTIPESVTSIGNGAFSGCAELKDVYCYAEQVPEAGTDMLDWFTYKKATLHVPATSIDAYKNANQWKRFSRIVAIE